MVTAPSLGFPIETVVVFLLLAGGGLFLDLFAHRQDRPISLGSAVRWSLFWIALAVLFALFLWVHHGAAAANLFISGYALEKVLSVDNLFVIMAIFTWFAIPTQFQHRVLYWGVLGAIVFRGIFVAIGAELFELGPWAELIFAAIVGWTAVIMLKHDDANSSETVNYSGHIAYRVIRFLFPLYPRLAGHHFFVTQQQLRSQSEMPPAASTCLGRYFKVWATPLLLCLMVIEVSDIVFAFDSVPAVIAVSREPLIVYSAMMFAVLGLRSLFFVLEALRNRLVHLEKSVVILLFFIAGKLGLEATDGMFHHGWEISAAHSLWVIVLVLVAGVLGSFLFPVHKKRHA